MVATSASRTALSWLPTKASTLSLSMSRTADFAASAGGTPASATTSVTLRPMMPPALLTSSAASSAQAFWVGPNSEAGPESAMNSPILKSSAARARRAKAGTALRAAAPKAPPTNWRRLGLMILLVMFHSPVSIVMFFGCPSMRCSELRRRHRREYRLERRADGQEVAVAAHGPVKLHAHRQAVFGQAHRQAQARRPRIARRV